MLHGSERHGQRFSALGENRQAAVVVVTDDPVARIAELEKENRELRRANAILKSASAFFASMPQ